MVSVRSCIVAVLAGLSLLGFTFAVPLADKLKRLSPEARGLLKRSVPSAPRFVTYNDKWLNTLPSASQLNGYNVFALSFLLISGPADEVENWAELSAGQRSALLSEYNACGNLLDSVCVRVHRYPDITHGLQGVDVDYEVLDFDAFDNGSAESWLISFTKQLRKTLPQGQYILTHAPVAPWFLSQQVDIWGISCGASTRWIHDRLVQRPKGASEYTSCQGLLHASSSTWPQSAVFEIAANGVDLDKIVIGKPGTTSDASNGYMSASTLAACVSQAHGSGWHAGVMVWEYPDVGGAWIKSVRGNTFPE
ncbi:glycoside hydrolase family 18 protein [Chiua virens]|nr:glycoside hydrolase family 18 protein [Chiua virens]